MRENTSDLDQEWFDAKGLPFYQAHPVTPAYATLAPYSPIYWPEAIAIIAFGMSWLVKGEDILKDE